MKQLNYRLFPDGINRPIGGIQHRNEEYYESGFESLRVMQEHHFWYRGRHRFLLSAVDHYLQKSKGPYSAIDLGGGVGGWVHYISQHRADQFESLALADSSEIALTSAASIIPKNAERYQVDLMKLGMSELWDAIFLLDVIEHLPNDFQAILQAKEALKPGGYLFVTTPAFPQFWSYNDDIGHHLRRYRRSDFVRLARESGLTLCDSRYFMFFLSPLYLLSRLKLRASSMTLEQKNDLVNKQHQVPFRLLNKGLSAFFSLKTPLGHHVRFPWGTSILGVFKKT